MKIYLPFAFLFFTILNYAQGVAPKEVEKIWTLQDCISYAVENNITIKSAELTKNSAQVTYDQSKAYRLPNLTSSFSQNLSTGNAIDPITSDYVSEQVHSTNMALSSSLTVFEGGILNNQIKQNKMLIDQNSLYVEESKNNITLSVLEAYLQALYSKEGINIAKNNLEASEKELERAKSRLDAGSIPLIDFTDAQSQAATNKYTYITSKNNYAQQILTLKQLLELGPLDTIDIEVISDNVTFSSLIPNKVEVYNNALENLPEMNAGRLDKEIYEKELDIVKGDYLPTLTLTGSLGSGYTSIDYTNFVDQLDLNFNQKIGLSLSIPIFNRKQTSYNVQSAKIDIQQSELTYATAQKELFKKIETAWQNASATQEQLVAAKVSENASAESYKLAQKKYELGALSTTDLIVAQNTYTNAKQNYLQAKYLSILYYQLLQFYQGNDIKL